MSNAIGKWARGWLRWKPHIIVGGDEQPYMLRWYIIPRNRFFNIYLHKFLRSDDDRALHDHPWRSASLLIKGRYKEVTPSGERIYERWSFILRSAEHAHRIELLDKEPVWTLFVTGPKIREWYFHCP